jgi:hypothetical protein
LCDLQTADERLPVDVIRESALALDLDDRQPFSIAGLELRIAAYVDLRELERPLRAHLLQHRPCPLAEVAALGEVKDDADGYG